MAYDSDLDSSGGFANDDPYQAPRYAPPQGLNIPPGYDFDPMTGRIIWVGGNDPATGLPYQPATFNPGGGSTYNPAAPDDTLGWTPATQSTGPAAPATGGGAPGGAGAGSGALGAGPTPFNWPTYTAPTYTPGPGFQAPPPFVYPDFKAPTLEEAQSEPGYAFAMDQGRRALENSAAAKGVLRTGGTLKDLFSWGNKFGEQNYGNVFNRDASIYDRNRNNAASAYATNYGIARDAFDRNYKQNTDTFDIARQNALDVFNPTFDASKLQFADLYNRYRDRLNSLTSIATSGAGL